MALSNEMKQIRQLQDKEAGVLSLYVSTKPSERGKWEAHLKNEWRRLEQEVEATGDETRLKSLKAVQERTEREIRHNEHRLLRSIIVFAEGGDGLFELHFLQLDVDNEAYFESSARLEQLERLDASFPATGIVLANAESVSVFDTRLGEVESVDVFELDVDTEQWRRYQGRSGRDKAASSSQTDRFDSRQETQLRRFYRDVAKEIQRSHRSHGWSELVVIGHHRSADLLQSELSVSVTRVVSRNLGKADDATILQAAFE